MVASVWSRNMARRQLSLCKFDFIGSSTAFGDICDDDIVSAYAVEKICNYEITTAFFKI
jgi:hypothetical protein